MSVKVAFEKKLKRLFRHPMNFYCCFVAWNLRQLVRSFSHTNATAFIFFVNEFAKFFDVSNPDM